MMIPNRRTFLKSTLAGLAVAGERAYGQAPIVTTPLGDKTFLLTNAGTNVVARPASDGLVLVDGGLADRAADLSKAIAALPGSRPVKTLYNTHWHPEQTGLNIAARRAGAAIVAHENTRLWMTTDVTRPYQYGRDNRTIPPAPKEALPTRTFYDNDVMTVDGERIHAGYLLQAHTDGDIYIHFTQQNVLCIGDITSANAWPLVDWWTGGWIFGITSGLDELLKIANADTKIVPSQGPVMTRAELAVQQKMYSAIALQLRTLLFGGRNIDDALAARPTREFDAQMGDPKQFIQLAFQSMWGHFTPDA